MPRKQLEQSLSELQRLLREADDIDSDVEERLKEAMEEIRDALQGKSRGGLSLRDRIGEAADDFEDSHPTLASTLGRVSELLARVGI
ncbi:MAG: DUF4404 family protein [Myxococcales bacterium]|nr:DUF4404 family protein [Myxococcales bacterium]